MSKPKENKKSQDSLPANNHVMIDGKKYWTVHRSESGGIVRTKAGHYMDSFGTIKPLPKPLPKPKGKP